MLDHVSIPVADLGRAIRFYDPVLGALGYRRQMESPQGVGYGQAGKPWFWIGRPSDFGGCIGPLTGFHLAFAAPDRAAVDAFHAAALAAGGRDNGGPGLRLHYHPSYYAAFVFDPDGHRIEAVCHRPEPASEGN
ncbi:VOC family protein [Rhodospirillum centenum]|uniref:Glyoxalase family protein n=1 Tax=Rhodospirillum centenum (strain ATCC 51521 / SW) TaxID=414684 RepID=B6IP91_RHOCS|nr:VOC family protein [Rhodospirillum centenum]ACI99593.1 glyoxalase family protein [Rhodospirillum centenum SW]